MQIKDNVRQRYPFLAFYNGFRCIISTCFGRLIIDLFERSALESNELVILIQFNSIIVHDQHVHPCSMWTNGSFSLRSIASKNVSQNQICQKLWLQIINMRHFEVLKVGLEQSRRNFGERVLSIFLTKIMAAAFNFNGSGKLGSERNLYQGGGRRSNIRRTWGRGSNDYTCQKSFAKLRSPTNSVWLVQLSFSCQSHAKCVIWASFWHFALAGGIGKISSSDCEVIRFDSALDEALTPTALR